MAEAIYINSAHQRVIGLIEFKKDWTAVRSSGTDGKECVVLILTRSTQVRIYLFSPFSISYRIGKAFIFNKNEGNNYKVEHKVLGRVRVGVGRALLSQ